MRQFHSRQMQKERLHAIAHQALRMGRSMP